MKTLRNVLLVWLQASSKTFQTIIPIPSAYPSGILWISLICRCTRVQTDTHTRTHTHKKHTHIQLPKKGSLFLKQVQVKARDLVVEGRVCKDTSQPSLTAIRRPSCRELFTSRQRVRCTVPRLRWTNVIQACDIGELNHKGNIIIRYNYTQGDTQTHTREKHMCTHSHTRRQFLEPWFTWLWRIKRYPSGVAHLVFLMRWRTE